MEVKILNEKQQFILSLLQGRRLKEAVDELERIFWNKPETEINTIKTTYEYMLKYMLDGVKDPERYKLHDKLIQETLELSEEREDNVIEITGRNKGVVSLRARVILKE